MITMQHQPESPGVFSGTASCIEVEEHREPIKISAGGAGPDGEGSSTSLILRAGRPEDAGACGTICYEAFKAIAEQHGFAPDFPSPEVAGGLLSMLLSRQ